MGRDGTPLLRFALQLWSRLIGLRDAQLKHLTTYHFDLRTQELKTPISGKALIQLCKIENEGAKGDDDEMLAVASHEDKSEA